MSSSGSENDGRDQSAVGAFYVPDIVIAKLDSAMPRLRDETVREIFASLSSYTKVDHQALYQSIDRNMSMAISALRRGQAHDLDALKAARITATDRYNQGVVVDQVIVAFRMSFSRIQDEFIASAIGVIEKEDLVRAIQALTTLSDSFTVAVVRTYQALQVNSAVSQATQKTNALRSLLKGERVEESIASLSLDQEQHYAVISWSTPDLKRAEYFRVALEHAGCLEADMPQKYKTSAVVLDTPQSGFGIVAKKPSVRVADAKNLTVGVGEFKPVKELRQSWELAARVLACARDFGISGVCGVAEVGWRLGIEKSSPVSDYYRARFITPVMQSIDSGAGNKELIETVTAWIRLERSIPKVAQKYGLHENTVRYRLAKFSELTSFDSHNADDLVGLLWALEVHNASLESVSQK